MQYRIRTVQSLWETMLSTTKTDLTYCNCFNQHCIYCNIRKRKADFPKSEVEQENNRLRHNEQTEQVAANQLAVYYALVDQEHTNNLHANQHFDQQN
jgi:hypothetical protein